MYNELLIINSLGVKSFIFILIFYFIVILYQNNFKLKFELNLHITVIVLLSFYISYNYILLFTNNPSISYTPTTKKSIYDPIFYATLYSINSFLYNSL